MPVIHLEYSDNLSTHIDAQSFLKNAHADISSLINTDIHNCKSRITAHKNYVVGNGAQGNAFVLLTVEILPGRTQEAKENLGKHLLKKLQDAFKSVPEALNLQFSCHIAELDKNYFRHQR